MSVLDVSQGRAFFTDLQSRIMAEVVRIDGGKPVSDAWRKDPGEMLQGDGLTMILEDGAVFDREVTLDAAQIEPMVTWGVNPEMAGPVGSIVPDPRNAPDERKRSDWTMALDYMGLQAGQSLTGMPVDRVFIGSCTNGRLEDLEAAAEVLRGRKVGVRTLVVPGSMAVKTLAEERGLADVFIAAGAEWRDAGCSMCVGMNEDILDPGERCASTSNRNFEGRQGRLGRTHLMSPSMAAAAAVTGCLTDVRELAG